MLRIVKRLGGKALEQWLFERALYLSEDDLNRIAGSSKVLRDAVRLVYNELIRRARDEWAKL